MYELSLAEICLIVIFLVAGFFGGYIYRVIEEGKK